MTAIKVTDPAHGSLTLSSDGSFSYVPALNYSGPDSFTYKANDGTADLNVATVNINVAPVNDPPLAGDDVYSTLEGTALQIPAPGVLSNDSDIDGGPLTAVHLADPSHGALVLNPDGSFTYTPAAGFSGVDSFTYRAFDTINYSGVATVSITVIPAPQPTCVTFQRDLSGTVWDSYIWKSVPGANNTRSGNLYTGNSSTPPAAPRRHARSSASAWTASRKALSSSPPPWVSTSSQVPARTSTSTA